MRISGYILYGIGIALLGANLTINWLTVVFADVAVVWWEWALAFSFMGAGAWLLTVDMERFRSTWRYYQRGET